MFQFKIDEKNRIVQVELAGIMSVAEVDQLSKELLEKASTARRKFGSFRLLVDAASCPVQPAEALSRVVLPGDLLKGDDDRSAVVVGSTLQKLQATRVLVDERVRLFMSTAEAKAWLLDAARSRDCK
jgi:hypothetical protein